MKLVRYVCTHCGRRFEAEEKDILECPGCFWSSSVKREEDLDSQREKILGVSPATRPEKKFSLNFGGILKAVEPLRPAFLPLAILISLAALLSWNWPRIETFLRSREATIQDKKSRERAAVKAESRGALAAGQLTPEENAVLEQRLEVSADREPSPEEKEILERAVPLQTGVVEKIPSQVWNYENFKQALAEQERFYKVPLPGSYKGKLEDLFKKKYLPGGEAFKAGDLLKARDFWVESLTFPVYGNDIRKHRGVVLTMLRSFINDTLSKIGTINSTLVENRIREKETVLVAHYQELRSLIEKKSWPEAAASALTLEEILAELEHPERFTAQPPPYPNAINLVDEGIRATLLEILNPPPPATADFAPLRADVQSKRKIIESFLPASVEAAQARYDEGIQMLRNREWQEAEKTFREVELPLALEKDSQEKVKILKKIEKANP